MNKRIPSFESFVNEDAKSRVWWTKETVRRIKDGEMPRNEEKVADLLQGCTDWSEKQLDDAIESVMRQTKKY
jgi:hypothetical protein